MLIIPNNRLLGKRGIESELDIIRSILLNVLARLYLSFRMRLYMILDLIYTNVQNVVHFTRSTNKLLAEDSLYIAQKEQLFWSIYSCV